MTERVFCGNGCVLCEDVESSELLWDMDLDEIRALRTELAEAVEMLIISKEYIDNGMWIQSINAFLEKHNAS